MSPERKQPRTPGAPTAHPSRAWSRLAAAAAAVAAVVVCPLVLPHILWRGLDDVAQAGGWRDALWFSAGLWCLAGVLAWAAARWRTRALRVAGAAVALVVWLWAAGETAYHVPYYDRYFHDLAAATRLPSSLYEPLGDGTPGYRLEPGARLAMPAETPGAPDVEGVIDAWGMRGEDTGPPTLPADALRLLVVGDSVTFGPRLPLSATVPAQTAARLGARLGRLVVALNAGVPGYNLPELAGVGALLPWDVAHPDLVVLAVCLNDLEGAHTRFDPTTRALVPRHRRSVLSQVVDWIAGAEPPADLLRRAVRGLGRPGAPPVVAILPSVPLFTGAPAAAAERDRATRGLVRATAAEERWALVDLTEPPWPPPLEEWFLTRADGGLDPYHFTAAGAARAAEALATALAPHVGGR